MADLRALSLYKSSRDHVESKVSTMVWKLLVHSVSAATHTISGMNSAEQAGFNLMYFDSYYIPVHGNIIPLLTVLLQKDKTGISTSERFKLAMTEYRYDSDVKTQIDEIQINYKCCGGSRYEDWITIKWEDEFYEEKANGKVLILFIILFCFRSVPFSCCDPWSSRPCIHTSVQDNEEHINYNYEQDITLYKVGCGILIDDFVRFFVGVTAILSLLLSVISFIVWCLVRLLHKTFTNALNLSCNSQDCVDGKKNKECQSSEMMAMLPPCDNCETSTKRKKQYQRKEPFIKKIINYTVVSFFQTYILRYHHGPVGVLEALILPIMLMILGLVHLITSMYQLDGWLLIKKIITNCKDEQMMKRIIYQLVAAGVIVVLFITSLALCIWIVASIERRIDKSIEKYMRNYRVNRHMKEKIDFLQFKFECCGRHNYRDWFAENWIRIKYFPFIFPQLTDNSKDNVPFSCCNLKSKLPCVHYGISTETIESDSELTINTKGCTSKFAIFVKDLHWILIGLIYTAHCDAIHKGDPCLPGSGYIFFGKSKPCERGVCDDENKDGDRYNRVSREKPQTPKPKFRRRHDGYYLLSGGTTSEFATPYPSSPIQKMEET
uniref:Tetraspanin n=1 Tax=Strigamia maritima TaxID=126957 RepID=T1IPY9_STRMM